MLKIYPESNAIFSGEKLGLNCTVSAIYKPNVTLQYRFLKDGQEIQKFSSSSTFVVNPVQTGHNGEYHCEAMAGLIKKMSPIQHVKSK